MENERGGAIDEERGDGRRGLKEGRRRRGYPLTTASSVISSFSLLSISPT